MVKDTGVFKGDTNAYTGNCASIGAEHHKKCGGVQTMSYGTNTCPCKCHPYNKSKKKEESND